LLTTVDDLPDVIILVTVVDATLRTLPQRLKYARGLSGFSGRRLGELAGVSAGYIIGVEQGRWKDPGTDALRRIASVLGVTFDWLLEGGEPPLAECIRRAVADAERQAVREGRAKGRLRRGPRITCPRCGHAMRLA
jgi:transcriptional regulator with XRE-family HTH domain